MVPAHERLEPDDRAVVERDDRLVVRRRARRRSSARRRSFSICRRSLARARMTASKSSTRPRPRSLARYIAASASRTSSSAVRGRPPEHARCRRSRETNARSPAERERAGAGLASMRSAMRDRHRRASARSSQMHARTRRRRSARPCRRRAARRVEPRGEQAQQLVAGAVAERVVDELEAVEVEEEHGRPTSRARRAWSSACARRSMKACGSAGRSAGRAAPGGWMSSSERRRSMASASTFASAPAGSRSPRVRSAAGRRSDAQSRPRRRDPFGPESEHARQARRVRASAPAAASTRPSGEACRSGGADAPRRARCGPMSHGLLQDATAKVLCPPAPGARGARRRSAGRGCARAWPRSRAGPRGRRRAPRAARPTSSCMRLKVSRHRADLVARSARRRG